MLAVPHDVYDAMVAHAIEGEPEEVCGILGGGFGDRESTVESVERATNVAPTPEHEYVIDPTEQFELMEAVEDRAQDIVGFYHSHPRGPAGPSATDAERATWPDRSYVIVDLAGEHPVVGAWRWDGANEHFVREVLRVT